MSHRHPASSNSSRTPARRPELSQHFFRDSALVRRWINGLPLCRGDTVIEIGPGRGAITDALAARGLHVVAVEVDSRLVSRLRARYHGSTNVTIVHADFLGFRLPPHGRYAVVGSVPFAATSHIVRRLLDAPCPPHDAWLVVQAEAAAKFAGIPRETLFSLLHKPAFDFRIERTFRRADFDPPPRVRASVLRISHRPAPLLDPPEYASYRAFVRGTFGSGRTIAEALRGRLTRRQIVRLSRDIGFGLSAPPSAVPFDQWLRIFRFVEHECLGHDPCRNGTWELGGTLSAGGAVVHSAMSPGAHARGNTAQEVAVAAR